MRRTNWRHDGPIEALAQVLARLLDAAITGFGLFRRYPVNVLFAMAVRHGVECRSLGFRPVRVPVDRRNYRHPPAPFKLSHR
ncbi:MAG: hypothetical protein WCE97_06970, partial [Candidatus Cybelea sp.]